MTKTLTLAIALCFPVFGLSQSSLRQQGRTPVSVAEQKSAREQDGLKGPVRRVRIETAKMIVKGSTFSEGPRTVRRIATYDPTGKKIDAVDYPGQSPTVSGKERYRYDDKGNVLEMAVVSGDGSVLSKESYEYEFDALGNWTKRATSIAVYENGKVALEPTEVTYRTISYYYDQAIEQLALAKPKNETPAPVSPPLTSSSLVKSTSQPIASNQPVPRPTDAGLKNPTITSTQSVPTQTPSNNAVAAPPVSPPSEVKANLTNTSTPSVLKVAEAVLRNAALELPQPEYPAAALLAQAAGRVEVQLMVNEKGEVTNARATSGNPMLVQAAEAAARRARFTPEKLSADPTMVFGVITYDFVLSSPAKATAVVINQPTQSRPAAAAETKPVMTATSGNAAFLDTKSITKPDSANSYYRKGATSMAMGRYEEAVAAFNEAIRMNPNDATAYMKLAMSYSGMKKHQEAVAGFKMAAQIKQSALDASAYYLWAGSYLALDKNSEAISAFKQALYILRAEAIGLEPKKLPVHPTLEDLHNGLGTAYLNARRFDDAIKEFKQGLKLNPENAEIHYALAVAYIADGDRRAAEKQHQILSKLDHDLALKIRQVLAAPTTRPTCWNFACR